MRYKETDNRKSYAILICGIILMVFGIFRGEVSTVFIKAVNVCLECIGIG
jgi:hypothetical protein